MLLGAVDAESRISYGCYAIMVWSGRLSKRKCGLRDVPVLMAHPHRGPASRNQQQPWRNSRNAHMRRRADELFGVRRGLAVFEACACLA